MIVDSFFDDYYFAVELEYRKLNQGNCGIIACAPNFLLDKKFSIKNFPQQRKLHVNFVDEQMSFLRFFFCIRYHDEHLPCKNHSNLENSFQLFPSQSFGSNYFHRKTREY